MAHCLLLAAIYFDAPRAAPIPNSPDYGDLPFGTYPHVRTVREVPLENDSLRNEVKDISSTFGNTVREVVSHRNATCLGHPCLIQGLPLIYNQPDSGFFAGAHMKIVDISRQDPILYALEGAIVRSDTQQWITFALLDIPELRFLPLKPRIKLRANYSRTTETRYFGIGPTLDKTMSQPDSYYRYSDEEEGFQSVLIIPVHNFGQQRINVFASYGSIRYSPTPFAPVSKLYTDQPLGSTGGVSSHVEGGFQIDSRDRELMTRTGWDFEVAMQKAGEPFGRYSFARYSLIDRRYFTHGQTTIAHRLTVDGLNGAPPFWELTGVGGIDSIEDINGSQILRGFSEGRFHERLKIMEDLELRYRLAGMRWFDAYTEIFMMPLAMNIARLGNESVASASIGADFLFNNALLVQMFTSKSRDGWSLNLSFGQDF